MSNVHVNNLGDTLVAESVPTVSGDAVYGFIPSNFRTFLAGTGTATTEDNKFKVTSGTSLGDYGVIRSFRSVNYKTGQGASFRMNGYFGTPLASTWSGLGAVNLGDELSFGYNQLNFGIWHRFGGHAEVRDLQVTGAAGGSESATVEINGTEYTVPLTSGTVQDNAREIAEYLDSNATGLEAEQIDDIVRVDFTSDGAKSGDYTFTSSTATATWSQVTAGVFGTDEFYPMDDGVAEETDAFGVTTKSKWNGDTIQGFDPSKGQNYLISFNNGFGNIEFFIETNNGIYKKVHTIEWANRKTQTNVVNPSLRLAVYATSIGATSPITVYSSGMSGFIYGPVQKTRNPRAFANTKSIATTLTNIFTIRNSRTYNGFANQVEIEPVFLTLANDGTKTAEFQLRGNATVAGDTNFQEVGTNLISQVDTAGTTVTENGRLLAEFVVAKASSITVDLTKFMIRQPPSLRLVIAGKMVSGSSSDLTAALTWYEDI